MPPRRCVARASSLAPLQPSDATPRTTQAEEDGTDWEAIKKKRAERFGIPVKPTTTTDATAQSKRAERFGTSKAGGATSVSGTALHCIPPHP